MKHFLYLSILVVTNPLMAQNWSVFNDTLTYYYQASNTGEYFTLRTDSLEMGIADTSIFFVDNYIPNDTVDLDEDEEYYSYNGSILGESVKFGFDTLYIGIDNRLYRSMLLGETRLFSASDSRFITYSSTTDTILFEIEDSVRYYTISDGSRIILSKSFGLLEYPKQNSDLAIYYSLVGIEGIVGLSFDHHNQFFDFEIGDVFMYLENYRFYVGDSEFDEYTTKNSVYILDKFLIDGHYHYQVNSYGGDYLIYPPLFEDNPLFDHPGEQVIYCRANDVYSYVVDDPYDDFLIDDEKFTEDHLGHHYEITTEGNLVQIVGAKNLAEYETFKVNYDDYDMYSMISEGLRYNELVDNVFELDYPQTFAVYEEGYGITYFFWSGGFSNHLSKSLYAAIKSGDTLGTIDLSIPEQNMASLNFYPNPTTNAVYLESHLSDIIIFNSTGQMMVSEGDGSEINVSILPAGTYLLRGTDNFGILRYGKFVKH
jgi:hypothetical protein